MHKTQTDSVRTVLALLLGLVELAAVFLLSKQLAGHRDPDIVALALYSDAHLLPCLDHFI